MMHENVYTRIRTRIRIYANNIPQHKCDDAIQYKLGS